MAHVSAASSGASQLLAARWQGFARWWLSGLKEVVPPTWLDWADGETPAESDGLARRRNGRLPIDVGRRHGRDPAAGDRLRRGRARSLARAAGLSREEVMVGPVIARRSVSPARTERAKGCARRAAQNSRSGSGAADAVPALRHLARRIAVSRRHERHHGNVPLDHSPGPRRSGVGGARPEER